MMHIIMIHFTIIIAFVVLRNNFVVLQN